jgi:ABC-type nitrate/sulfonate/bicarbonate transport system permease component
MSFVTGLAGLVAIVIAWQLVVGVLSRGNGVVPTPIAVVRQIFKDGWSFYWPNIKTTVEEAAKGWLWGNGLAILLATLFLVAPVFEKPLLQVGVVSFCLPSVAIAPVLATIFRGETPKVVLAALAVFFTTLIGALIGLRSADASSLDMIHAFGGGKKEKLTKVRIWASLPSLFAALRIAAPAAVLGAVIGEYIGGSSGLGVAMINSEQSLEIARTWGIAGVLTGLAILGYALTALVARLLMPWAPKVKR